MKKIVLYLVVLVLLAVSPAVSVRADNPQVGPPIFFSGWGRPTIDGIFSTEEWGNAACMSFDVNLPGGTTTALAYIMNDALSLYAAVLIPGQAMDWGSVIFEFDNDNCGDPIRDEGDDIFQINTSPLDPYHPVEFQDLFRTYAIENGCCENCLCGRLDNGYGGWLDGQGQALNDGTYSVYEFSHPLDSLDDAHDFSLKPGDTVGFTIFVSIQNIPSFYPAAIGANALFGDIVIMQPMPQDIVDFIAGLSDQAFINNPAQRKNAFEEKLKSIEKMIDAHKYAMAIDKLQQDIRPKGDGCYGGNPHNDWIVGCEVQKEFLVLVDALIEYLTSLL